VDFLLEKISSVLRMLRKDGSFVTRRTLAPSSLRLKVRGAGQIRLPVTARTARDLCGIGRPARHGYKEETRLDLRVRDTWEIMQQQIMVDEPRWLRMLVPALGQIREDLGLSEGCTLEAALHNLLVYAPGQFFRPHQDSEKGDGMIGTLVVILPSRFSGGEMLVEHQGRTTVVRASEKELTLVAFYADCHHQVRPVLQGFRVALTYNLYLRGEPKVAPPADQLNQLTEAVKSFLELQRPPEHHGDGRPEQLVCLLDHEYTEHGLAWSRLKGADIVSAAALREVARRLDLHVLLNLAEVHEEWDCEDYPDMGTDGWPGPPPATVPARKSRDESESSVWLRHYIDPQTRSDAVSVWVRRDDMCWMMDSVDLPPFKTKYEPYMGNWGNTLEYWYHRAAIALWPRDRIFIIQAKASPLWAISEIGRVFEDGRGSPEALRLAQQLLPSWPGHHLDEEEAARLLAMTAPLAAKLGDASVAGRLLAPHALGRVGAGIAEDVAALLDRYGLEWFQELLRNWIGSSRHRVIGLQNTCWQWPGSTLTRFCQALCHHGHGEIVAREILTVCWTRIHDDLKDARERVPATTLRDLLRTYGQPFLGLLETAALTQDRNIHEQILEALTADGDDLMILRLEVLRLAIRNHRGDALHRLGLASLHVQASYDLAQQLAAPERTRNNWSIATRLRCECSLCQGIVPFLTSSKEVLLERLMSVMDRRHLLATILKDDLPVRSPIWDASPHNVLVLAKTRDLFDRAQAERRSACLDLEWLREVAEEFRPILPSPATSVAATPAP
jgi:hypothetical protein